ncbi:MAG TPA: stage II sporulation protein R [Limnochordales bacterium]
MDKRVQPVAAGRTRAAAVVRRTAVVALIAVLIVLLLAGWRLVRSHVLHAYDAVPVFRLHVVPHSDAPFDQDLKLAVRDAVLPMVLQLVDGAESAAAAHERLLGAADDIAARAYAVVQAAGADYPVTVTGEWDAGGEPVAVRILIGAGRGSNWFCVLFPPLCFTEGLDGTASVPGVPPPALQVGVHMAGAPGAGASAGESLTPAAPGAEPGDGVMLAWRWLDWLPGFSTLLLDGLGQMHQDDVHADLAHALPGDGHIRPAAE